MLNSEVKQLCSSLFLLFGNTRCYNSVTPTVNHYRLNYTSYQWGGVWSVLYNLQFRPQAPAISWLWLSFRAELVEASSRLVTLSWCWGSLKCHPTWLFISFAAPAKDIGCILDVVQLCICKCLRVKNKATKVTVWSKTVLTSSFPKVLPSVMLISDSITAVCCTFSDFTGYQIVSGWGA